MIPVTEQLVDGVHNVVEDPAVESPSQSVPGPIGFPLRVGLLDDFALAT